ncbi:unnamed protein product [Prorocentrum cordatum]|uniref:Uncharacterized protein n=1 Tax=Prorocentrum cordatum TaxID=2364126 RepID=A0ABN9TDR7_9DINO|nr:unnamed protein product [Polarella glacialis]
MAAARRVQVDQALASHEERLDRLERASARHESSLKVVLRSTVLVCEGFTVADQFYMNKHGQQLWRELREGWPEAVCSEAARHLGVAWPLDEPMSGVVESESASALRSLWRVLATPGLVTGVWDQSKWSEDGANWERIPGTFVTTMAFGTESLLVESALRPLDALMRRASGLVVRGQQTRSPDEPERPRVLLYLERPENKGKGGTGGKGGDGGKSGGKGKSKGKGSKGSSKGKKGGKGGKGAAGGRGGVVQAAALSRPRPSGRVLARPAAAEGGGADDGPAAAPPGPAGGAEAPGAATAAAPGR